MATRSHFSLGAALSYALAATAAFGPIGTSRPSFPGGTVANLAPPGPFFQGFQPPFPTDTWWVGYGAPPDQGAVVAGPWPFESSLTNTSIQFGISTKRDFDGSSIHQPTQMDWGASFVEHTGGASDHKALAWDMHSVTVQYFQRNGAGTLTSAMVPGSPYITLQYSAATPLIISRGGNITSINGQAVTGTSGPSVSATKFTVVSSIGTYIIYSLNGAVTLSASSTTLRASAQFNGVLRMARLGDPAHQTTLDTYAPNYPTAVATDYTFSGDSATLTFTYSVTGTAANLLMLTFPHHRLRLQNPNFLATTAIGYLTTTGWMYGNVGNVWRLPYTLSTIDFNAPRSIHSSCTAQLTRGLEYEIANLGDVPIPNDYYFWGGRVAAVSRLALIADQLGRTDLRTTVVNWLKTAYSYWTDTQTPYVIAAYETGWGGVVDKAAALDPGQQSDFGNGYYNDHHFHYGYYLAAASVIAKFDPSWLTQTPTRGTSTNGDMLQWYARNIANPSTQDPFFTTVRHMDWFAGHSWASGIAGGAGSRDQESTGEAINGYYGVLLYAVATNNANLRNFARLLVAIEQEGAKVYWHMDPAASPTARDNPYPEQGIRDLVTIGNVQDWQSGAWLFWGTPGQITLQIAAIQILPHPVLSDLGAVAEALYEATWVNNMIKYTTPELSAPTSDDSWKSVIYLALSNVNPQDAAQRSTQLSAWGSGNTYSNQLYFLSTRPNPSGQAICPAVTNVPEGTFLIQDVATGRYVVSTAATVDLLATATAASGGTPFVFGWQPGSNTIKSTVNNMFVTADSGGTTALASARTTASSWEAFKLALYTIVAASNGAWVATSSSGALINSATSAGGAGKYRLVPSSGAPPTDPPTPPTDPSPITGNIYIQDVSSGSFLNVVATDNTLHASEGQASAATVFKAAAVSGGGTSFQQVSNSQYMSADDTGANILVVNRAAPSSWETFDLVSQPDGSYLIRAHSNSKYLQTTSAGIVNSGATTGSQYRIVAQAQANPVGTFTIQLVSSGRYVSAPTARQTLVADATTVAAGTTFIFAPVNGTDGGSIQSTLDNTYVSADIAGNAPLYANRPAPSTWETFRVRPAAAAGTYTIQAFSNNNYLVSTSTGLMNSATAASGAATFRLV
ncbi:hypothetical protein EXIGLDRAFT_758973 [Exidia glandulosa HHB12029]|uniref:glucan endo-1,3-beta-D-glucosidase n=1 Tax=Exidia glandulosa HHB12029 TaxID=1314781 RepID=A0A165QHL6_EXIGL|nr:hypothetical protein EXIGLDRAFT_758973 [Exidia glandulosa HHB12029]